MNLTLTNINSNAGHNWISSYWARNLKIRYERKNPPDKTRRHPDNYLPKDWSKNWKKYWQKKKNVLASNRRVAQQRIDQAIRTGGAEIEQVAPKIISGAIEEVYKTPFRLLGNLGKKQFQKIKRKLFKWGYCLYW